jgi:hypothetical protein
LLGPDGFGKEYSEGNFNRVAANARAVAAQAGIKSKADGYQLANQAYAEGRITESDLIAAHQSFNMMYDKNGYSTGQALMGGRTRGIEVAQNTPNVPQKVDRQPASPMSVQNLPSTESAKVPIQSVKAFQNVKVEGAKVSKNIAPSAVGYQPLMSRSKEEVRAANRTKYSAQAQGA